MDSIPPVDDNGLKSLHAMPLATIEAVNSERRHVRLCQADGRWPDGKAETPFEYFTVLRQIMRDAELKWYDTGDKGFLVDALRKVAGCATLGMEDNGTEPRLAPGYWDDAKS